MKGQTTFGQPYGDLTVLNTRRVLLDALGEDLLKDVVQDYLELLDSSAAIYEANGDYALGIFSSGWCRLMDATSRRRCGTDDNAAALGSGRWHCHESCWSTSRKSIESRGPADEPCLGGIRIHAVPVVARGNVVGSINFGYGDPPEEEAKLQELAARYGLTVAELGEQASRHPRRPAYVVEIAKKRLANAARLIGALVERAWAEREREANERALRDSEARYRRIFDAVPVSIWEEDWNAVIARVRRVQAEGHDLASYMRDHPAFVTEALREVRILDVNDKTLEMFGAASKEQMLASLETVFATPDTLPGFEGELRALGEGRQEYTAEMALRRVDGTLIHALLTMTFPHPGSGSGLVLVSVMDVTDKKEAEERLARSAVELARSNEDLQEFAFVASHDLHEPLRKIATFSELLRARSAGALDERALDYLGRMEAAAERMGRLVESLLDLSRVTTRGRPFAPTDLSGVVSEALTDLDARIQQAGARVEVGPLPVVQADPDQVRRLFQNLLSNALKFHAPGRPPVVRVSAEDVPGGGWRITVEDEGIGFEERYLGRIFKPFQRLHGRREYEGSGMGLAICRKIAARHGGDITARSRPGRGSAFVVALPARPPANGA